MSIGFCFIPKIVSYNLLMMFLNHCSKVCHFTNIEFKENPTLISQLFSLSTFENFLGIST